MGGGFQTRNRAATIDTRNADNDSRPAERVVSSEVSWSGDCPFANRNENVRVMAKVLLAGC
jgi:hypothetical protein